MALLAFDFANPGEGEALISSTRIAAMVVVAAHGAAWLVTRGSPKLVAEMAELERAVDAIVKSHRTSGTSSATGYEPTLAAAHCAPW